MSSYNFKANFSVKSRTPPNKTIKQQRKASQSFIRKKSCKNKCDKLELLCLCASHNTSCQISQNICCCWFFSKECCFSLRWWYKAFDPAKRKFKSDAFNVSIFHSFACFFWKFNSITMLSTSQKSWKKFLLKKIMLLSVYYRFWRVVILRTLYFILVLFKLLFKLTAVVTNYA